MSRPAAAAREDGEVEALRRRVVALEAEVACLRRGAEQSGPALRAAEILESIDDAFYALDRELRFTYVNRHALAFWGRTAAQLLGEPVFAAFPQGKGSDVHRGLASALETGSPVRLETFSPVIHRWLAFNIYPSETGLAVYFRDIDDQKRGEAALREGEARLRGLFEGANDAILLVDRASGRYVDWNRRVLELTGYSADELAAKRLGDLTVPEQLGPVRDRLARLAEGESAIIEYDLAGKGGRRVPVELSARLLRVGGTVLLQAIMRDLTERRAAERAVRESAERLRLAVEATGLGTWDVDPATGLRSWSDEFKAICGLPPEAPADYAAFDALIDPDDRAWVEERYAAAFRPEGGSYDAEFRIRRADDGTVRWVRTTGRVHFEGGRPARAVGTLADITARRAVEEALRESEERLRATQEHAGVGIGEIDARGRFLRVNEALCAITGCPREVMLRRSIFDFTHPDALEEERDQYRRQVEGTLGAYTVEKQYRREDERERWVSVASSAVRDVGGRFLYGVRIVQDITDRKLAEARQRLLVSELNHRVKNTLAVVQSIAARSLSGDRTLNEARDVLTKRLQALAKAHLLLTAAEWRGAKLRELAEAELKPYAKRAEILGEDVTLSPKATLSLGLVLHELATNAAKHGALSAPGGQVSVAWEVLNGADARSLRLVWRERGGPPVPAAPRKGFGRVLIEQAAAYDLGGRATLDLRPDGAVYELEAPLGVA